MTRIVTSRFRVSKRQLGSEVCVLLYECEVDQGESLFIYVEKLVSRKVFTREEGSLRSE